MNRILKLFLTFAWPIALVLPHWAMGAAWTNLTTLSVSANDYYSLAVRSDGTLWGWGSNYVGQLGSAPSALPFSPFPRRIDGFTNAVAVSAGGTHSLALTAD